MTKYDKELITSILLECPECGAETNIYYFNRGVIYHTLCTNEECGCKWEIEIKIKERARKFTPRAVNAGPRCLACGDYISVCGGCDNVC